MNVGRVLQASAFATAITRCANRSWGVSAWWVAGLSGKEKKEKKLTERKNLLYYEELLIFHTLKFS